MLPGEPEYERILDRYRQMMAAVPQGPEGLKKLLGPNWIEAASQLIQQRKESIPDFQYEDPENGTVSFPPAERPLRQLLQNQRKANPNSPGE